MGLRVSETSKLHFLGPKVPIFRPLRGFGEFELADGLKRLISVFQGDFWFSGVILGFRGGFWVFQRFWGFRDFRHKESLWKVSLIARTFS